MTQIYETMVLLDNDVVRQDWKKAKAIVTDTVAKYGGGVETCRRWDERRLTYPMKRKNRATYYLAYHDMPGDKIPGFLRDLELNESVLRYMMLRVEEFGKKTVQTYDGSKDNLIYRSVSYRTTINPNELPDRFLAARGFMMKYDGESEERGAWLASDGLLLDATEGISMHWRPARRRRRRV